MSQFSLSSDEFEAGGVVPSRFTCEAENVNPALQISNVPENTKSFAIVVTDPDIPEAVKEEMGIDIFDHWVAYNIPPSTDTIPEDEPTGTQGQNSMGEVGYTGPCPPADKAPTEHRYFFHLYALDTTLDLPEGATRTELEEAIAGRVTGEAELIGTYEMQT